jgi:hypothetical protein
MVPDGRLSRKHRGSNPPQRYRLYTNVQAAASALQHLARFVNRGGRQSALLIGSGVFRRQRRLTGFRNARNIVCIRTKVRDGDKQDIERATQLGWPRVVTNPADPTV